MSDLHVACSAPGKVILFGEHAVVYGIAAIAAATSDLRLRVDLTVSKTHNVIRVNFHDIKGHGGNIESHDIIKSQVAEWTSSIKSQGPLVALRPIELELQPLREVYSGINPHAAQGLMAAIYLIAGIMPELLNDGNGLDIDIKSHGLPIGAGLGSSAAFSVAIAGAFLLLRQKMVHDVILGPWTDPFDGSPGIRPPIQVLQALNDWAYASEVVIHGTPSGLDNFTSCFGGVVKYDRTSSKFEALPAFQRHIRMLLTNTKIPRSTKILVRNVRILHDDFPQVVQPVLDSIGGITAAFIDLLQQDHETLTKQADSDLLHRMKQLISMNQHLLAALGVSHPSLELICDESRQLGFAAKLTGAGGGGCAITLIEIQLKNEADDVRADNDRNRLVTALHEQAVVRLKNKLRSHGFDVFESSLGGDGVLWHYD